MNIVSSNCTVLDSCSRSNYTALLAVTVPGHTLQPNNNKAYRDAPVLTNLYLNIPVLNAPPVSAPTARGITT
jgi:hypothetical protein